MKNSKNEYNCKCNVRVEKSKNHCRPYREIWKDEITEKKSGWKQYFIYKLCKPKIVVITFKTKDKKLSPILINNRFTSLFTTTIGENLRRNFSTFDASIVT